MSVPRLPISRLLCEQRASWRALAELIQGWSPAPAAALAGTAMLTESLSTPKSPLHAPPNGAAYRAGSPAAGTPFNEPSNEATSEEIPADGEIASDHAETWALVERVQQGDGEAFGKLYDRYVNQIFRFIYYRVNDRALAEDFTSETFLRALRRMSSINYQGRDIGAWFMTIARNIVFDHTKSARFRLEVSTGDNIEPSEFEAGPEAAVLAHLTNTRLLQAVNDLGQEQKECIVLRFLQGLSVAETAAAMGKNDGAIKALQHRAVKRLSGILADELL
jgi:RNA polymerase sigma-70 factor (ECF subfamily)